MIDFTFYYSTTHYFLGNNFLRIMKKSITIQNLKCGDFTHIIINCLSSIKNISKGTVEIEKCEVRF